MTKSSLQVIPVTAVLKNGVEPPRSLTPEKRADILISARFERGGPMPSQECVASYRWVSNRSASVAVVPPVNVPVTFRLLGASGRIVLRHSHASQTTPFVLFGRDVSKAA